MANLKRVRVTWSGAGVVGPGLSTFYFTSTATGFSAQLQTFFQAIKSLFPPSVTVTVPNTGDLIDASTGALAGVWTDSGGSTTVGTGSGNFALGTGMRVRWVTGGIHKGRRVLGTTFLVPCVSLAFDTDGTPGPSTITVIATAASALIAAAGAGFQIWSKPTPPGGSDGVSNQVLAAIVPDTPSGLRTRRS